MRQQVHTAIIHEEQNTYDFSAYMRDSALPNQYTLRNLGSQRSPGNSGRFCGETIATPRIRVPNNEVRDEFESTIHPS